MTVSRTIAANKVIDDYSIGNLGDSPKKPLGIDNRKQRRHRNKHSQAKTAQVPGGLQPFFNTACRRWQTWDSISIALDRDVKPKVASALQLAIQLQVIEHSVRMRLQNQRIRREDQHRLKDAMADLISIFLRQERIRGTGHEDAEASTVFPRPSPLRAELAGVNRCSVRSNFQERTPGAAARHCVIVLHVAAYPTHGLAKTAPSIGL